MLKLSSGFYIFTFFLTLVTQHSSSFLDDERAKISSSDGDLIIETPKNRNIMLKTQGTGRLRYNAMDLTELIQSLQNSFDTIQECKASVNTSDSRMKTIESSLKLLADDFSTYKNSSINRTGYSPWLTVTRRRVNIMQRKLRTISITLNTNECLSNPCSNGGTCFDMYNSFFCQCPQNWEGPRCETDVNECARFTGTELGCQNSATCVNKPGTYECICTDGWFGLHCTKRSADCSSGTEICGHGTCVSQTTGIGYTCICDQGWKSDGVKPACTVDVDECKTYKPPCSTNPPVTCVNLPGTFYCGHCPIGYTGNGFYCTDIDECAIFNGGCSVNPMVQCINTLGSSTCGLCPPGYIGNGMSCRYQGGICAINNGGCHPMATCRDNSRISSTYVECQCPPGYVGNGIGTVGCILESKDACNPSPCIHGDCILRASGEGYACSCKKNYMGVNCDIRTNQCESNPCQNGGTCKSLTYTYVCICPQNYDGSSCENMIDECGGTITGETGTIQYPNPNQLRVHNCNWKLNVAEGKVLNITFQTFNFPNCRINWLQIYDGINSLAPSIGRFCGSKPPKGGNFISSDHNLYIWYRVEGTPPLPSFTLTWEAVSPVCGGEINVTTHGSFKSPGSPGNYPLNRDCYWRFKAPLGKRILFHFFSFMIGFNKDCNSDYLEFRQGLETTDPVIGMFCNSSNPEPLYSSGNEVLAHFHSDDRVSWPGFQITYTAIEGIPGCGGIFTLDEGEISSPTFNGEYPANTLCEYKIKLPNLSKIILTFRSFSLEHSPTCEFDYVAIYDGPSIDSPLIGKYCGTRLPVPVISVSSEILIVFKSDWNNAALGFNIQYKTICGGKFTAPNGTIQSTNYPNYKLIRSKKICNYEIIQPVGSIIVLNITDLDFGNNTEFCDTGYLEITDMENANPKNIQKYCKKGPMTIKSTYNLLKIAYVSNFGKIKGFKLEYNVMSNNGCGGILKEKFGSVESPTDLNSYQDGLKCVWILVAPLDYVIQLTWIKFNLEESYTCVYDSVKIFDNSTDPGSEIGTYCGHKMPPTLLSSSNTITIFFEVDNSNNEEGFLFSYTFIHEKNVCGGKYFTPSGIIKSPHYPDPYPVNKDCVWVITVPPGQQIMLNSTIFNIESYLNCRYDFLEIRNGGTAASPLIGKYCGKNIPKLIPSHTNQLYLHFKSDMTKTAPGFQLSWTSTATGCGGTLTSPNGMIISPHYPEPYSKNLECYWKISVSAGSLIQIVFADLELEMNPTCVLDYVEVYDGLGTAVESLGKFCMQGTDVPPYIRSTANHMTIKFRSDLSFQGRGFQIQYSTVCNNKMSGFWGVIESPNYPNSYPSVQNCLWEIGVTEGNKINITFSHFELGRVMQTNSCSFDYLQIHYTSRSDENNDVKLTFCNSNVPDQLTIDSNTTEIQFVTDKLFIGTGFRLEWNIFGCGGVLTKPKGTISTPGYPNTYPRDTRCEWILTTEYGSSIEITFDKIDMEKEVECAYDFIAVYNGKDDTYPLITQFCHSGPSPINITSNGNTMLVRFQSDSSYTGRGFEASYKTVPSKCGGVITTIAGSIHSPNYPKNYDKNDSCVWLIQVQENHVVNLTIEDIDFPKSCNRSFIKVYDGPSQAYPVLTTLCGSKKPNASIVSTTNNLVVEMVTHPYFTTKGFLAKYEMGCGYILTDRSGLISLNEHTIGSIGLECAYTIKNTDPGDRIFLTITHLSSSCGYDNTSGIFIYDGMNNQASLIGRYCGSKVPPTLTSSGSYMHIEIINDENNFEAHYVIVDTACGGVLESVDGYIATPEFPNNYPADIQCEWTIPVSPGNTVNMEFSDFDIAVNYNCNEDYLEIREKNNQGKLLGVFCGTNTPTNISSNQGLWLSFKSAKPIIGEQTTTGKGFKAEYEMVHGQTLNGSSGQIASPLYPRKYKGILYQDNTFIWTITVKPGYIMTLKFLDFDVDYTVYDSCFLSFINVYDGDDDNSPELGSFCGTEKPADLKTTSNVAYIKASLDFARRGSKFLIEWNQSNRFWGRSKNNTRFDGCGSDDVIDISQTGIYNLTSPNYPGKFPHSSNCTWFFSTTNDKHLAIYFYEINIRTVVPCQVGESISIYSMQPKSADYRRLSRMCYLNRTTSNTVETSNMMKVVFNSYNHFLFGGNYTGFFAVVYEKCGGNVEGPNGIIQVQNISSFYSPHRMSIECQWNVTVRSGKTIKVEFLEFQLGDSNCNNYLMLKNGQYQDSPLLGAGKYCGNKNVETLETSGNFLYLKYFSMSTKTTFKLRYSEESINCGGKIMLSLVDNSSTINSPNYPNVPSPHTECEWIIIAPGSESVRLDFQERFDLIKTSDCSREVVELRNGGTHLSPLIGRFCKDMPNTQVSIGNMMYIKYFTNDDFPRNGFKAKVSIASCGGVIRSRGTITSPNYNKRKYYPTSIDCRWSFIGPRDHVLQLDFDSMDLPFSFLTNCSDVDHVTISEMDLLNNTEVNLGQYCGSIPIKNIMSSTNQVFIRFVTNKRYKLYNGFKLSFKATQETCGGTLTTETGTIMSPGYPVMNHFDRNCLWTIKVRRGQRVKINIEDLDLDKSFGFFSQGIAVFDGEMFSSPVTYLKAGNNTKVIRSSDNFMSVFFWSHLPSSSRGFKASYTSDEPTVCIGDLNQARGVITRPNGTTFKCMWKREVALVNQTVGFFVKGNFSNTRMPCTTGNSYINVHTGEPDIVYFEICKTTTSPAIFRTSIEPVTLMVSHAKEIQIVNFEVTYKVYPCGGSVKDGVGSISSPTLTDAANEDFECSWLIQMSNDQGITINFPDFDLGNDCNKHHLTIYSGPSIKSPTLGQFCGTRPNTLKTTSSVVLVEYHRAKSSPGKGFKLSYEVITNGCGGIVHSESTIIQTRAYPEPYPENAECLWEIRAPPGYHINLNFTDRFQIESSDKCQNDYVMIFNKKEDESNSDITKYCGRDPPARSLNSSSNNVFVLFRSNSRISGIGFRLRWKLICGGVFYATGTLNHIVSPGFPNKYSNDLYCNYTIVAPNQNIIVDFEEFELEKAVGCLDDSVSFRRKLFGYPSTLSRYCGTQKPPQQKQRNSITIIFQTDRWITKRGFKFSYRTDECGGNITGSTIIGQNVTGAYIGFGYKVCKWNILAPKGQRVTIRFLNVNIMPSTNCMSQYIEVADTTGKLADVCGNLDGNTLPIIHSNDRSVTVKFRLIHSFRRKSNFEAAVYFTPGPSLGCGGDLTIRNTSSFTINAEHATSFDCVWKFTTDNDFTFKIDFLDTTKCDPSNAIASPILKNCSCGLYEIRDGITSNSEIIASYCDFQSNTSISYYTSKKYAFIRIVNVATASHNPKITIKSIPSICGPNILKANNTPQYLTTPNYPNGYQEGIKCIWQIKSYRFLTRIQIKLIDFDINANKHVNDTIQSCSDVDSLEIKSSNFGAAGSTHDVISSMRQFPMLLSPFRTGLRTYSFCSKEDTGFYMVTKANEAHVVFNSGYGRKYGKGIKLEYQVATCNRNYTDLYGTISKTWYGNNCSIYITVPKNNTISLYFNSISFYSFDCNRSSLVVYDGDSAQKELLRLCRGNYPSPVFSTGNQLHIRLFGNTRYSYNVFEMIYTTSSKDRGCGGDYYGHGGVITSPLYPESYTKDITCEWTLRAPQGLKIGFTLLTYDIQGTCIENYLSITVYRDQGASEQKFCPGTKPAMMISNKKILIVYKTSHTNLGTGWKAKFITDFDSNLLNLRGV